MCGAFRNKSSDQVTVPVPQSGVLLLQPEPLLPGGHQLALPAPPLLQPLLQPALHHLDLHLHVTANIYSENPGFFDMFATRQTVMTKI